MSETNQIMSVEGQLVGMPLAGPESFSDGQLAYLKRALDVDETVLFDADGTPVLNPTLSELPTNFERLRIVYGAPNNSTAGNNIGIETMDIQTTLINGYSNGSLFMAYCFSGEVSVKTPYACAAYYTGVKTTSWTCLWSTYGQLYGGTKTEGTGWIRIHRIVGIKRIAGGNQ